MIQTRLTPEQFDDLAEKLRVQEGIPLTLPGGLIQKAGATVVWSYDRGLLTLTVHSAPFGLKAVVEGRLKDALQANGVVLR